MIRALLALALVLALPAAARAAPPRVAADIPPVHSLVARVMEGVGAPDLVVTASASPHGFAMAPSEARRLARAELVVWIGPALAPWLERAIGSLAPEARSLRLLEVPGARLLPYRAGADFAAHAHDPGAPGAEETDPHAWLDPANARAWLPAIAAALAELDPENAAAYAANAAAAEAEIAALEGEIAARLAPFSGRPFLVAHDAYHYFEARFGIEAAGAVSLGDADAPGPRRLARLRALLDEPGPACVFVEPQQPERLIAPLIEGTEARLGRLDPLGARLEPGPALYPALLRGLAEDLAACLSALRD